MLLGSWGVFGLLGACGEPAVEPPDTGGWVYGWGADGVWVQPHDGAPLVPLTDETPDGAHGSGKHLTTWRDREVTVWSRADGSVVQVFDLAGTPEYDRCPILDALRLRDTLYLTCACPGSDGKVLRADDDGRARPMPVEAAWFQLDHGTLYLGLEEWNEEQLWPVDAQTLAPRGRLAELNQEAQIRNEHMFSMWGEKSSTRPYGGIAGAPWSEHHQERLVDLPDGWFPLGVDAWPGALVLVDAEHPRGRDTAGMLFTWDGEPVDTFAACPSPRLDWRGDRAVAWCAGPVRWRTWTWSPRGWEPLDEVTTDLDLHTLGLVEPGD